MAVGCGRPALPSDVFSAGTGFGCDGEDWPLTQRPLQNQSRKEVEPSVNSHMVQTFPLFNAQLSGGKSNIGL